MDHSKTEKRTYKGPKQPGSGFTAAAIISGALGALGIIAGMADPTSAGYAMGGILLAVAVLCVMAGSVQRAAWELHRIRLTLELNHGDPWERLSRSASRS